mmetsp:Transcript_35259/g.64489  ORF Transcript_35259/g.64489 Transcript_35259/m.64489 type:complete len:168 (+) Transcript_35259:65-568(+)
MVLTMTLIVLAMSSTMSVLADSSVTFSSLLHVKDLATSRSAAASRHLPGGSCRWSLNDSVLCIASSLGLAAAALSRKRLRHRSGVCRRAEGENWLLANPALRGMIAEKKKTIAPRTRQKQAATTSAPRQEKAPAGAPSPSQARTPGGLRDAWDEIARRAQMVASRQQ